jgi:hypothetical protein
MKIFKIRCSAIGQIMAKPKKKTDLISKTAAGYCEQWLKEEIYNRKKSFTSKFTDKGLIMEDHSIDFISNHFGYSELTKNEDYFENDFLTGTPDIVLKDCILELKNSWDCFTFPLFDDIEQINKAYYYQTQGYMMLTGLNEAKLIYTLMDTPYHLIEKEYKYSQNNYLEFNEFEKHYLYNEIKPKHRIKTFEIKKDQEVIDSIIERVKACRNYIEILKNKL